VLCADAEVAKKVAIAKAIRAVRADITVNANRFAGIDSLEFELQRELELTRGRRAHKS